MKVIYIRSNPVNPDSRVEKQVTSLVNAGYDLKVLAWDRYNNIKRNTDTLLINNLKVPRINFSYKAEFGSGMKSLIPFIKFQIGILTYIIKERKNIDIIHAADFDTAFTSLIGAKLIKRKLIFDIYDFLYSSHGEKISLFGKMIVKLQYLIINKADATIICTEERKRQIEGSNPQLLEVIHNSPKNILYDITPKENKKTKITYVGILQEGRFLKELAEVVIGNENLELHIGGFGKFEDYFNKLSFKHENIIYYGRLSYKETLELESQTDILTAIYDPSVGNHHFAAPNKFYEALMLGKPLIMVRNTGMSNIVEQHDIGQLMNYNKESLIESIEAIINRKSEWPTISERMKKLYKDNYSWEEMEKRLLNCYKKVAMK